MTDTFLKRKKSRQTSKTCSEKDCFIAVLLLLMVRLFIRRPSRLDFEARTRFHKRASTRIKSKASSVRNKKRIS